jgi:hypothetical protein
MPFTSPWPGPDGMAIQEHASLGTGDSDQVRSDDLRLTNNAISAKKSSCLDTNRLRKIHVFRNAPFINCITTTTYIKSYIYNIENLV